MTPSGCDPARTSAADDLDELEEPTPCSEAESARTSERRLRVIVEPHAEVPPGLT